MTLRYRTTKPRPIAWPLPCSGRRRGAVGGAGVAPGRRLTPAPVREAVVVKKSSLLRRDAEVALDLGDHAVLLVEEGREHLVPAAEVGDGEQAGRLREVLARRVGTVEHRPVAVLREDLLRLLAPDEVQERLGLLGVLGGAGDRRGVLDQDGRVG